MKDAGITAGHQRVPRTRSRRVGAAALDVSGCGRAGRAALAAAGARPRASRRARPRARAARRRRRADRRLGARDAQSPRLDGESAAAGTAALRAGVRRRGSPSGSPRTTRRRSSTIGSRRRRPRARIRRTSTTCRCWSRGARPETMPRVERSSTGFEAARSRTISTSSGPHRARRTGTARTMSRPCTGNNEWNSRKIAVFESLRRNSPWLANQAPARGTRPSTRTRSIARRSTPTARWACCG